MDLNPYIIQELFMINFLNLLTGGIRARRTGTGSKTRCPDLESGVRGHCREVVQVEDPKDEWSERRNFILRTRSSEVGESGDRVQSCVGKFLKNDGH